MSKWLLVLLLLVVTGVAAPALIGAMGLLLLFLGVPVYMCWLLDGLFAAAREHLDRR